MHSTAQQRLVSHENNALFTVSFVEEMPFPFGCSSSYFSLLTPFSLTHSLSRSLSLSTFIYTVSWLLACLVISALSKASGIKEGDFIVNLSSF